MAITFSYTESTNKVVVTEGISGTPATFADFVHFDRTLATSACTIASGAELKAAATIGADTDLTLTYPMRPVENKALRLAITTAQGDTAVSGDETIDIFGTTAVWHAMTGASASGQKVVPIADGTHNYQVGDTVILIDISAPSTYETDTIASINEGVSITLTNNNTNSYAIGDIVGIYQTEQIDSSAAHQTWWTTLPYGQIAMLTFTGYAGTNTGKVDQPIWGVIWDYGNAVQYQIDCYFDIGDESTTTWFKSLEGMVVFSAGAECSVKTAATLNIGELSNLWGRRGSSWEFSPSSRMDFCSGGTINIYASKIHYTDKQILYFYSGITDIKNSILSAMWNLTDTNYLRNYLFRRTMTSVSLQDVYLPNVDTLWLELTPTLADQIHVHEAKNGLAGMYDPVEMTKANATSSVNFDSTTNNADGTLTVVDPLYTVSSVINFIATGRVMVAWSANFHIVDKAGTALSDVSVLIEDISDNIVCYTDSGIDLSADETITSTALNVASGDESGFSQGDIIKIRDEFMQVTSTSSGIINVTKAFYSSPSPDGYQSQEFRSGDSIYNVGAMTTDGSGNTPEIRVAQKQYWNTDEGLTTFTNHKLTLSKAGYQTLVKEAITVDKPIVWDLELQPIRARLYGRYRRAQISNFE